MKNRFLTVSLCAILFASCGGNVANNNQSESEKEVNWDCPICKVSQYGDTIFTYKYDQNGNLVELSGSDFTTSYQYDANNRLVKETNDCEYDAYIYEYVYDKFFDCVICPENQILSYATTNREGYKEFKSRAYS